MKNILLLSILLLLCNNVFSQENDFFSKANNLIKSKNEEKALELALEQIDICRTDKEKAKWFFFVGKIFEKNSEFDKALHYYHNSYHLHKKLNDSLSLMKDHLKIGSIYHFKFNEFEQDDIFSNKATQVKDSALFYYEKNINEFKNVHNGLSHISHSHNNIAYIYSDLNLLKEAQNHVNIAISGYQRGKNINELDNALLNKGLINIYLKKYDQAIKIHLDLLNNKRDTSDINTLKTRTTALGNLSYIYKKTNDFKKAYEYAKEKSTLEEIILEKEKAAEITAIEAKYNQDKARQEEAEKTQREIERRERMQLWFGISGLVAVSVFLFGLVVYRNSKLKQKSLTLSLVKQELEQQRALKLLQKQNQNKVINATLDGREKERKDIAQTLHDSVSALLSSANLHLQVIKKKSPSGISEIEKSQRIINEASDKVRDLSHKLISAVLLKFGLEHAVYDMCEKYSNEDLTFELESEDKIPRFNQAFEIKLHNIIEEFINNIIKHSKASDAIIKLNLSDDTILNVDISDNGIGFNTSKIEQKSNGIGLSQIIARIESLKGTLDIKSAPNEGTKINIIIPVEY